MRFPTFRGTSHHDWLAATGLLLLLVLFAGATAGEQTSAEAMAMQVQPMPGANGRPSTISADGLGLIVPGNNQDDVAGLLRFTLPARVPDDSSWMIWMDRDPVDSLQLRRGDWRSEALGFFRPHGSEGPLPNGYAFALPNEWHGDIELELHARGDLPVTLRPRLISVGEGWSIEQRGITISAMVYASLFTIALLALALFSAARDRLFLGLFGCATITLLALAAVNGHLYQSLGLRWLAAWGAQGLLALILLLCASIPQLLLEYAGIRAARSDMARWIDVVCVVLVALAALCLVDLRILVPWLPAVATVSQAASAGISVLLVADAVRRRVPMAWPLAALVLLTVAAALYRALAVAGILEDSTWTRPGYQIGMAISMAILAVGLISRISAYRDQRDRDQLARADSERRMRREASRSDLNVELQLKLRNCQEHDVVWTAFRLLLDHLAPLLRVENSMAIARAYHGQDVHVVVPVARQAQAEAVIGKRELAIKRHAANGIPLQQPVAVTHEPGQVVMEAMIPLQIRAPAWGMLLLERKGGDGFTTEELALAGEFARLTLGHIDQALTAIQLRRSAELDALTGSFNRRTIDQWLVRSFHEAERDGQPISVLFIDMDHFKAVNDKYGHACGDLCLRQVAQTLRAALGEGDLFGRYGGEEFIAVLPGRGGAAARVVGEQLRGDVERLIIAWEGQDLRLTVSVGVATRLHDETQPADTIGRADKALYTAKRGGRNCVHVAPAIFS